MVPAYLIKPRHMAAGPGRFHGGAVDGTLENSGQPLPDGLNASPPLPPPRPPYTADGGAPL